MCIYKKKNPLGVVNLAYGSWTLLLVVTGTFIH